MRRDGLIRALKNRVRPKLQRLDELLYRPTMKDCEGEKWMALPEYKRRKIIAMVHRQLVRALKPDCRFGIGCLPRWANKSSGSGAYWQAVREQIKLLDPEARVEVGYTSAADSKKVIWIVSKGVSSAAAVAEGRRRDTPCVSIACPVPPVEGRVFAATPYLAAKCIVDGTHAMATPKQVAAYQREMGRPK